MDTSSPRIHVSCCIVLPHCYLWIPSVCCFPFFSTLGLGDILPFQKRFSVEKCNLPGWPACASGLKAVVRSGIKNPITWLSLSAWAVQGVWGCSPRAWEEASEPCHNSKFLLFFLCWVPVGIKAAVPSWWKSFHPLHTYCTDETDGDCLKRPHRWWQLSMMEG